MRDRVVSRSRSACPRSTPGGEAPGWGKRRDQKFHPKACRAWNSGVEVRDSLDGLAGVLASSKVDATIATARPVCDDAFMPGSRHASDRVPPPTASFTIAGSSLTRKSLTVKDRSPDRPCPGDRSRFNLKLAFDSRVHDRRNVNLEPFRDRHRPRSSDEAVGTSAIFSTEGFRVPQDGPGRNSCPTNAQHDRASRPSSPRPPRGKKNGEGGT